jgi:hypothetical protein
MVVCVSRQQSHTKGVCVRVGVCVFVCVRGDLGTAG